MKVVPTHSGEYLWLWCPGCKDLINISTSKWSWNGDLEKPTISPSILTHEIKTDAGHIYRPQCHSFVVDGVWQFLNDCGHEMAGQHVPMGEVEWPEWLTPIFEKDKA